MKYIRKGPRPLALRDWEISNRALPGIQYGTHNFPRAEVQGALVREQGWICAYTMIRIGANSSHIEHLKPQTVSHAERRPEETYDYGNMVACYPGTPHSGDAKVTFGAIHRGSRWDRGKFITPLNLSCELRIRYRTDGHVRPKRSNDAAATWTINTLNLDDAKLVDLRRAAIEGWGLSLAAADPISPAAAARAIASVRRRNREDSIEPFCVAIEHAADDYISLLEKNATRARQARGGNRRNSRR